MLASESLWVGTAGTVVLWAMSSSLSMMLAALFAAGSLSNNTTLRVAARVGVNFTRGVPTSLFVIAAGIGMTRLVAAPSLPVIFPGTAPTFQHVAWGIVLALALGSAGHLRRSLDLPAPHWAATGSSRREF